MRLLFLSLCFVAAGAQQCASSREFSVENCTACLTFDQIRSGDIPIAVCKERPVELGDDSKKMEYVCVCSNFPSNTFTPYSVLRYYPQTEGNVTWCTVAWTTAPQLYTTFSVVTAGVALYAAAHLFYIVWLSGMCCCTQHGCTKANASALCLGVCSLIVCVFVLRRIVAQDKLPIAVAYGLNFLSWGSAIVAFLGQVFFYTSIADVAYPGEDNARQRCFINAFFWCLAGAFFILLILFVALPKISGIFAGALIGMVVFQLLSSTVFMIIAHKTMHEVSLLPTCIACTCLHCRLCMPPQVVRKQSSSKMKPPLIVKMDELCGAICRYFYLAQV